MKGSRKLYLHKEKLFMKIRAKQIAAIICIILLVLLYAATLVVSILDFPGQDRLFATCLGATVGLPILLWIYIWLYGRITEKGSMAELFPSKETEDISENTAEK